MQARKNRCHKNYKKYTEVIVYESVWARCSENTSSDGLKVNVLMIVI